MIKAFLLVFALAACGGAGITEGTSDAGPQRCLSPQQNNYCSDGLSTMICEQETVPLPQCTAATKGPMAGPADYRWYFCCDLSRQD